MGEKKEGKENEKCSTMPDVLIKGYKILRTVRVGQDFSLAEVEHKQSGIPDCLCGSHRLIHYDSYRRYIKHVSENGAIYHLKVKCKRYKCLDCGRVFRERLEGVRPYARHSERFKNRLVSEYARNVCNKAIARIYRISASTVERAIHSRYEQKLKEQINYPCPEIIGIDEHTIHKGYKFATTIADLSHHRVYDVIKGKKHSDIESTLMSYKGRENVKVVCMDLSSGYRSIVRRCFPRAKIVADRFHVIRLVLHHFMEFCKSAQEEVKWNRKITYPLRKRRERLKAQEMERLKSFSLYVKDCGMGEKKEGKENKKCSTMPNVLIKGYKILRTVRVGQDFSLAEVEHKQSGIPDCLCGSHRLIHYDSYRRYIKHVSENGAIYHLKVKCKRYKCLDCGRVFRERLEGVRPYARHSERFKNRLVSEYARNVCNKAIARIYRISASTVERAIHSRYEQKLKEQINYPCPEIIGIDEHTIHKGYKFATTIADLSHHRVYDVIKGKKHSDIESTLMSYKGRENVKVVCMDLSSGYRSIVRRCFPRAKIVADRFHVIRLVLHHFMEFCKSAQEEVKWNRKITYPLRKRRERLKAQEMERLKSFFRGNPAIELAYEFKERLCGLLNKKSQTAKQCRDNIRKLKEMMKIMKYEAPTEFGKLAETIGEWFAPIIRMWRFTKNNGITEGFHRKMKLIQRRAYGYRNFENYRLRVLVECGVNL